MAFLSKWRTVTAFLLHRTYGQSTFSKNDDRGRNIAEVLQILDSILRFYATESSDEKQRLHNLEEILKRAARFGFLLFSQPSLWKFEWDEPLNSHQGSLVIFPGLLQIGDDNGQSLPRPRRVGEQEIYNASTEFSEYRQSV